MTFSIKQYGQWKIPYWKNEVSSKMHISKTMNEYSCLDNTLFKDILKDELDVPDYAINEKNIKKEFGYSNAGYAIPEKCMKNIIRYYKWRKNLYSKICKTLLGKQALNMLNNFNCSEIKFKYNIPAEYNNFSCEDPEYDDGQLEAYLEIGLHR